MILRGQYSSSHQGEHECISQWDDAIQKAKIVVKAEASSSAPNISTGRPLVPTSKQAASAITFKVPFEDAIKIVEVAPSEETKLDAVPQGIANSMDVVVMQQKAMISALVKQQTMMLNIIVDMNKNMMSAVEDSHLGLENM
ncbi:hypothetical protein FVEN_g6238 [Fusarium venenatum]|nr:hypothetical protein FVEN_g6238 [Fusarium venenatum]